MNHSRTLLLASLIATSFGIGGVADGQQDATAKAHAEATGDQTSTQKRTVTVTSDGKRTIKKTVIENNGVKETITEITDENGNTTTTRNGGNGNAQDGGGDKEGHRGPWLGVRVKEVSEALRAQLGLSANQGVLVDAVAHDSPADEAGIREGDLMLSINSKSIASSEELADILDRYQPGTRVEVEIMRDGQRQTVEVTLEPQPANANRPGNPPAVGVDRDDDAGGRIEVEVNGGDFDAILNNPEVPEGFKKTVRDMQRRMEQFRRKHQIQPAD